MPARWKPGRIPRANGVYDFHADLAHPAAAQRAGIVSVVFTAAVPSWRKKESLRVRFIEE
jgi:hypothetical protein